MTQIICKQLRGQLGVLILVDNTFKCEKVNSMFVHFVKYINFKCLSETGLTDFETILSKSPVTLSQFIV